MQTLKKRDRTYSFIAETNYLRKIRDPIAMVEEELLSQGEDISELSYKEKLSYYNEGLVGNVELYI